MNKALLIGLLGLSSISLLACGQQGSTVTEVETSGVSQVMDQTVELGKVQWNRDLEQARKLAAESGKPMFVQFQEVPG